MKNRLFKLVLASMVLSTGFNTIAMDAPEPMEIEGEVTLVSEDGAEFPLPLSAAKRAGQLAGLLEMPGQEGSIAFNELSSNTLAVLVPLLIRLDQLIQRNEQADKVSQIYIPRAYQPFAIVKLISLKNRELAALYNAADFLDIPFILNATAAVIADRVYQNINKENWDKWPLSEREKTVRNLLIANGFDGVNLNARNYIMRQMTHRMSGIRQEYSIADYITQHGQPQLVTQLGIVNTIDLKYKQLTSLFGIELLQFAPQAALLNLAGNRFFEITLDPQGTEAPFGKFTNLREIFLSNTQLMKLPERLFAGLANLQRLHLDCNQIIQLPEGLFAGLANLHTLFLAFNQLTQLPGGLFAGLANLQQLHLAFNQLTQLPGELFVPLANLRVLNLDNNQLTPEEKDRIRKEVPDRVLIHF